MSLIYTPIGFDIRTPGQIGCGAEAADPTDTPFRPSKANGIAWLTFDKYINPSVFISNAKFNPDKHHERIVIPENVDVGFDLFGLWDNMMEMIVYYTKDELTTDAVFAYAIPDLNDYGLSLPNDDTVQVLTSRETIPAKISDDWVLLGYDIVSPYFISALAGYTHQQSDREFIRILSQNINHFGLISHKTKPDVLSKIIHFVEEEINEDPFFIVALFLVSAGDQSIKKSHISSS
jgi:hypothetical protein